MTDRESDHWSIGEVLSLIQEEFPDVTISKIRFLESQGLINPERTPSGYRRFFQKDFERLQWILRQQRDHYLPLKVIRTRLESGDLDGENEVDTSPVLPFDGPKQEPHRTQPRTGQPLPKPESEASIDSGTAQQEADHSPVHQARPDADQLDSARSEQTPDMAVSESLPSVVANQPAGDAMLVSLEDETSVSSAEDIGLNDSGQNPGQSGDEILVSLSASADDGRAERETDTASTSSPRSESATPSLSEPMASRDESASGVGDELQAHSNSTSGETDMSEDSMPVAPDALSPKQNRPTESAQQRERSDERRSANEALATPTQTERRGRGADRRGQKITSLANNSALTKDELSEASGCSLETLGALERFGLLSGRTIGPTVLYDSEALLIAQLAAKFVEFGLEPRHLRSFKIGAEREVGLLTQVVEPLLYRRDENARRESLESLDEMIDVSAELRAILIRQLVREQLPSQRG